MMHHWHFGADSFGVYIIAIAIGFQVIRQLAAFLGAHGMVTFGKALGALFTFN